MTFWLACSRRLTKFARFMPTRSHSAKIAVVIPAYKVRHQIIDVNVERLTALCH